MTKQTEALKMAHKTFMQLNERHPRRDNGDGCFDRELKAINEALEQPNQFSGMKEIPYKDWVLRFYKMPNGLWYTEGINEEWMNAMVEASKL